MGTSLTHAAAQQGRYVKWTHALLLSTVMAFGVRIAYQVMFSGFATYDDEGYMLLALLRYVKSGGLYSSTYTWYGPVHFFAERALHVLLHIPVNHDGGRFLSLLYWIAAAALPTVFVYRLTRIPLLASLCFLITLRVSSSIHYEPGHPQGLILCLVEGSLFLTLLGQSVSPAFRLMPIGIIAALLVLTKVNVGLFYALAVVITYVALLPPAKRWLLFTIEFIAVLLPLGLVYQYASLGGWTVRYGAMALMIVTSLCLALTMLDEGECLKGRPLVSIALGFILGTIAVSMGLVLQRMPVPLLIQALIGPLKHRSLFYLPLWFYLKQLAVSGIFASILALLWIFRRRLSRYSAWIDALKVCTGIVTLAMILLDLKLAARFTLPILSLLMWEQESSRLSIAWKLPRLLLCSILAFEFLQTFPIAGSQLGIALAPAGAWSCLLMYDGIQSLRMTYELKFRELLDLLGVALHAALVCVVCYLSFKSSLPAQALSFPGSRCIRVTPDKAETYRKLGQLIRANCDILFTIPGLASLNIWSGVPTPSDSYNLIVWMSAFKSESQPKVSMQIGAYTLSQQQKVLSAMRGAQHPCVVFNPELTRFWMMGETPNPSSSPLSEYVFRETLPIALVSGYQLRAPSDARSKR